MKLETAIARATDHFLKSDKARTYRGETLKFWHLLDGRLECQTWGYDYASICIPVDRAHLIRLKIYAQLGTSPIEQIAKRYYLDILRRESK